MSIAFIGGGHMTTAIVAGMIAAHYPPSEIIVADRNADKRQAFESDFGVRTVADIADLSTETIEIIILSVKPADISTVCAQISHSNAIIVSVAAGIALRDMVQWLPFTPTNIARIMPNTPFAVGEGMSACYADSLTPLAKSKITDLFSSAGKVLWLEEESMLTAATAISGGGPAYVYYFAEAMEEAALNMGFNAAAARLLVTQTLCGGSKILAESHQSAAELCTAVATPGGTTERAIEKMKSEKLKAIIQTALRASQQRAEEIGIELAQRKDKPQ